MYRIEFQDLLSAWSRIAAAGDDSQNSPGDGYPNRFTEFVYVQVIPTGTGG